MQSAARGPAAADPAHAAFSSFLCSRRLLPRRLPPAARPNCTQRLHGERYMCLI
jgi:hypothetical protein